MKESKKTPDDKDKKKEENVRNNPDDENEENKNDKKKWNKKMKDLMSKSIKPKLKDIQKNLLPKKKKSQSNETPPFLPTGIKIKKSKKTPDDKDKKKGENVRNNPDDGNEENENDKKKRNPKDFLNKSMNPKWKDIQMKILPKKKKSQSNETTPFLPGINPPDCTDHKNGKSQSNETLPLLPGINPPDCSDIEEYDEEMTLLEETKELNAEVQEMYSGGSRDDERINQVASSYRDLRRRVFQVINDFITNNDGNLLKLKDAIEAIEEEGREDRRQPWQPWKSELEECVALSVTERINRLPKYSSDAPGSRLSQVLAALGKAMKDDLKYVRENLILYYPEECDVYNIYAQQYHRLIKNEISLFIEDELEINDIHCLLSWIHTLYPTILRDLALTDQLEELLPAENIQYLEKMYINCQQGLVEIWMTNALELVEKRWKEGDDSELSVDVIQIYLSAIEVGKEISEDFVNKMTPVLASEFLKFLKRYERAFKIHCENYMEIIIAKMIFCSQFRYERSFKIHCENYKEIIIANMICCSQFRDFIKCANAEEDTKEEIYWILNKIEYQGVGLLLQGLFPDIKSHFIAIHQKKGQYSQENMLQMIQSAITYMSNVTTPDNPCYQVMAGKVHMHLVQEYIATIKDISPCNIDEQKALATQMHNTADILTDFCNDQLNDAQMSEATLVNNKIHKIATIIKLEDLEAIKLDVAVLIDEYPDIKKKDVMDILKIKKNLNFFQRISVERIMDPPNGNLCRYFLRLLCPCLCAE